MHSSFSIRTKCWTWASLMSIITQFYILNAPPAITANRGGSTVPADDCFKSDQS